MNTPKRISRKLDMDRAGVKDVAAAPKQALREFANRPTLLKESAHVRSKRKRAVR